MTAFCPRRRRGKYDGIRDALVVLWESSDRVCGKRLVVMLPTLLPAIERHGRLKPTSEQRALLLWVSAATIDRMLVDVKVAAAGGRRRRVGFYSAIRREVPIRTFNDWGNPPPGFCEIDMVAHGGTSVAGSFIQTLTMVDIATRLDGVPAAGGARRQSGRGSDGESPKSFPMAHSRRRLRQRQRVHERDGRTVVPRPEDRGDACAGLQEERLGVRRTEERRRRAPARYGRFDGIETARVMARLYAAAQLLVNFFQPSFKLKEKRREGAKVIKRYHIPATPYARALAHPKLSKAIKRRLRETYRSLDPVALLAEVRRCQDELGERIGKRGLAAAAGTSPVDPLVFAQSLGTTATREVRATHRRPKRKYKKRIRMPSKLDPHLATIESWLAAEPHLTALSIVQRLAEIDPATFGGKQHSIVQRLLRALRRKAAETVITATATPSSPAVAMRPGPVDGAACNGHSAPPTGPPWEQASKRSGPHRSAHAQSPLPGNIPW